jgi:hypothetical protein
MAERATRLLLHLDEEQRATATQDEIQLVPPYADVRVDEAVSAEPVVGKGAALAAIHAASTSA